MENTYRRLFIGIALPEVQKTGLKALQEGVKRVHWVEPELFHITLHFLGAVPEEGRLRLQDQLLSFASDPLNIQPQGVGFFASGVLWAGIAASDELLALRNRLGDVVQGQGLRYDIRPFCPHITLGKSRERLDAIELADFLGRYKSWQMPVFRVEVVNIYESVMTDHGLKYPVLMAIPLLGK